MKVSACTVCMMWTCLRCTHFLWLSVRVIPCEDTLKWTTVEAGGGLELRVILVAFCTAWTPVSDSISTEQRYHTLQAGEHTFELQVQESGENMFGDSDRNNRTKRNVWMSGGCTNFLNVSVFMYDAITSVIMSIRGKWRLITCALF